MKELNEFEQIIQYSFHKKYLLENALTHSSYANEKHWIYNRNNERLEFLGDAVLELVSSDFIFHQHDNAMEGDMTKLRASLVCERSLAYSARQICLGQFIRLGKGEDATGGRDRDSILSDAFEAIIGAMYLDGGLEIATVFVKRFVLSDIENRKLFYDSKTTLQELVQAKGMGTICYELVSESGPDHAKTFEVHCMLNKDVLGSGMGHSKKTAEQNAAYEALCKMKNK